MRLPFKFPLLILVLFLFFNCSSDDSSDAEVPFRSPEISTQKVSAITQTSAEVDGNITSDGGAEVRAKGIAWSLSDTPTTVDNITNNGAGNAAFTGQLSDLTPNTTYFVRAYATNEIGTSYGEVLRLKTLASTISVTTLEITDITETSASGGGSVLSDNGAEVSMKGLCWSDTENPTVDDATMEMGTGLGEFSVTLSNLNNNTEYFVRAYGIINGEIVYGNQVSFETQKTKLVYEGDVVLTSQQQVDEFTLTDYTNITGNLIIGGSFGDPSDINDITKLSSICEVGGDVIVRYSNTSSLEGLENLVSVGEDLVIIGNTKLASLAPLNRLNELGGDLSLGPNIALTSIDGFNSLSKINGALIINEPSINNLNGFSNITSIGSLRFGNNNSLKTLSGLDNLSTVEGDLLIFGSPLLENLSGLESLDRIGGLLLIQDNAALQNIQSLSNLMELGTFLYILHNPSLSELQGLEGITTINNDIIIEGNKQLEDLTGLDNLTTVTGNFTIRKNESLKSLNGLNILVSSGGLDIRENIQLPNVEGLESLTLINGTLRFWDNSSLISITGLEKLETVTEVLTFETNYSLVNIDELVSLNTIGQNLVIIGNNNLQNIDGLSNINELPLGAFIVSNLNLENLNGLSGLNNMGRFTLQQNPQIVDLNGLQNVESLTGNISIRDNSSLSNLCGLRAGLSYAFSNNYDVTGNLFNPSLQDLIDGDCSN